MGKNTIPRIPILPLSCDGLACNIKENQKIKQLMKKKHYLRQSHMTVDIPNSKFKPSDFALNHSLEVPVQAIPEYDQFTSREHAKK